MKTTIRKDVGNAAMTDEDYKRHKTAMSNAQKIIERAKNPDKKQQFKPLVQPQGMADGGIAGYDDGTPDVSSNNQLPVNGQDVQTVQNLGFMDRLKMVHQGLDPSDPTQIQKFQQSQPQNMADGGAVKPSVPEMQRPMGPAPLQQPAPGMLNPAQMQMAALKKVRGY